MIRKSLPAVFIFLCAVTCLMALLLISNFEKQRSLTSQIQQLKVAKDSFRLEFDRLSLDKQVVFSEDQLQDHLYGASLKPSITIMSVQELIEQQSSFQQEVAFFSQP